MSESRRQFLKSSTALAVASGAAAQAPRLPTVRLGKYEITRLVVGANTFYGYSHFNRLYSQHMLEWFTPERVCQTLRQCEGCGINTWQFSQGGRGVEDLQRFRAEGGKLHAILLSGRPMEEDLTQIPKLARLGLVGIVHHGGTTDRRWRAGEQQKIRDFLKAVRDSGVLVGLSSHNPMIIEATEEQGWDIDFYMTCVYQVTRTREELQKMLGQRPPYGEVFLPDDPPRMYQAVRQSKKTCLAFKVLAAGRVTDSPKELEAAFRLAYTSIKPQDAVIVGMYPRYSDQVQENCELVRRLLGQAS
ncbi:MAG: twin-arginine translocation signal domain-containing protein [Acidobacteria bacterium]|nr:twin-arginine translocation signal domain-containing protein [Acidobacteriota bacterium]